MLGVERFNQIDYRVQIPRLVEFASYWRAGAIVVELNAMGIPLVEDLVAQGLPVYPFMTTGASKAEIIERLVLAFEKHQITIQPDEDLIGELEAFSMTTTAHMRQAKYGAPAGLHDDMVMSLAFAYYGVYQNLASVAQDEAIY